MPQKCIAISTCALLALLCAAPAAFADATIGVVTELQGRLLARGEPGAVKVLGLNSPLHAGDLLASKKDTYARVTLADGTTVTLKPDTLLKVEKYNYDAADPAHNVGVLNLSKGGVRIAAGRLGAGGTARFTLVAGSTTVDIGSATFIAELVVPAPTEIGLRNKLPPAASAPVLLAFNDATQLPDALPFTIPAYIPPALLAQNTVPSSQNGMNPGLYVQVLDGMITVANGGGTQNFTAGQFGFTPGFQQPPVILPTNPGMQFTPPPSFSTTTGSQGGASAGKPGEVDCIVR
jgi:hypothetical protein